MSIHPFFDGNARVARLIANIPVLRSGAPPIVVPKERRLDYLRAIAAYQLSIPGFPNFDAFPLNNERAAFTALCASFTMTHIDTAELYTGAEEIVAEAIRGRRSAVFVSKVMPSNASYKGVLRACDQSLKRLKTDYLDVYLRQVVLNFLTRDRNVFVIPKSDDPRHVGENAGGVGWYLEDGDIDLLNATFPPPLKDEPLDML